MSVACHKDLASKAKGIAQIWRANTARVGKGWVFPQVNTDRKRLGTEKKEAAALKPDNKT